jgi:hypothetical protein
LTALIAAAPASGIALGQLDDFQGGTTQFWAGGGGTGSTLINIPNAGFYGNGDHCLQITAANSNLGINNTTTLWTGNYAAAQVARIGLHLNNTGANPLALRIMIFGPGGTFATANEIVLPAASGWVSVEFGLDASSLVYNGGGGTGQLADTLANVSTVLVRHDPDPLSQSGQGNPVTGQLRIDNIRALPLPSITLGQSDDFQDGTTKAWKGVASPTNVASGGPAGPTDRYFQISASSSHLGTHNALQWRGDYLAAQIGKIRVHLNNTGVDPLALRFTVFGPGGNFTTTNALHLPPGSGWVLADFALDAPSLTYNGGAGTGLLADTLANVGTLLIRHDPDPISPFVVDGDPVTGTLGIDNVTALPEPGSTALLAAGIGALGVARPRRRSRTAR